MAGVVINLDQKGRFNVEVYFGDCFMCSIVVSFP